MLRVYNSLGGTKENFKTVEDGVVRMYVCGVTVYDDCHLGHARGAINFDVIRNWLQYRGYKVTYVRNFTDIDDKIIKRANEIGADPLQLSQRFIGEHAKDFAALGVGAADLEPKATDHIDDILAMISRLEQRGLAYTKGGDVYFRATKFKDYGKLSGRKVDELIPGARVVVDSRKEHAADFVLWKSAKAGEPFWESPWGRGRPGWHIECSAMAVKLLGETIDIHGGGMDLIFPHHENEVAQSEGATGQLFVRHWLHNGLVMIEGEKMSKSLGNFFTIKEMLAKYDAETVRFFILSVHYRSPIDFSHQQIMEVERGRRRIADCLQAIDLIAGGHQPLAAPAAGAQSSALMGQIGVFESSFAQAMDDDFNTGLAIAAIFELVRGLNGVIASYDGSVEPAAELAAGAAAIRRLGQVLNLFQQVERAPNTELVSDLLDLIMEMRADFRAQKEWQRSDNIRDRLAELGIELLDGAKGTRWKIKSTDEV